MPYFWLAISLPIGLYCAVAAAFRIALPGWRWIGPATPLILSAHEFASGNNLLGLFWILFLRFSVNRQSPRFCFSTAGLLLLMMSVFQCFDILRLDGPIGALTFVGIVSSVVFMLPFAFWFRAKQELDAPDNYTA